MRVLFSIFLVVVLSITGLAKEYSIENINIKEGLPNSNVNCMIQDDLGFLWIGTANGLCRYDGYRFEVIPLENTNADQDIRHLKLDSQNHLWISTLSGNLMYYNIRQESFIKLIINQNDIMPTRAFELQNDSILWIGTQNGLRKYITKKKDRMKSKSFNRRFYYLILLQTNAITTS